MARLLVLVVLLVTVSGAEASDTAVSLEPTRCTFALPKGVRAECYWLSVPERHERPAGKAIRLYVARFLSRAVTPRPDPVLFLAGGPGGSGIALASYVPNMVTPYLGKRDLIVLEQRGTLWSRPTLDCRRSESDAECVRRLRRAGHDLAAYTTEQNTRDIEALRVALGLELWNVYGESYGTRVALTLMRDFPEHLRSVILDSSFALQTDVVAQSSRSATLAIQRLIDACAADVACRRAYGDVEQLIIRAYEQVERKPLRLHGQAHKQRFDVHMDGELMLHWLYDAMYESAWIPQLPRALKAASDGRSDPLWRAIPPWTIALQQIVAKGVQIATWCADEVAHSSPARVAAVDRRYPTLAPFFSGRSWFELCRAVGTLEPDPRDTRPVRSAVPTLVLAGHFDPITTAAQGRLASRSLLRSFFFEFPTLGHWVSPVSACARRLALAFLDTPARRPDSSCLQRTRVRWSLRQRADSQVTARRLGHSASSRPSRASGAPPSNTSP